MRELVWACVTNLAIVRLEDVLEDESAREIQKCEASPHESKCKSEKIPFFITISGLFEFD